MVFPLPLVYIGAYPSLEARFTGDRGEHHLLDRPRDRPVRTAIGASWISLHLVLLPGGGSDIVATRFHLSVNTVTWAVRIAVFVVPAVVLVVTRRVCLGLRLRDRQLVAHGRATGVIKRLPHGEYVEVHEPLDRARLHILTAHDRPAELVAHGPAAERPPARREGD
ncbi:hypothetical protein GCM10010340_28850 [Streptomyces griseoloalbus]|nr:hypothetical protein GCM10010340_28850 [Streptomyces albaduncus]